MKLKGCLAAIFCILVWGATFVNTSELLKDFSSLEILIIRFLLAWIMLVALTRKKLVKKKPVDEWLFIGMGVLGASIYQLLENCAIYYTDATNVAILTSIGPIFTSLLVHFFCGEALNGKRFWVGAFLAMTGGMIVSLDGILNLKIRPLGDLMVVAAVISWAAYSVLVKIANDRGYDQVLVIRRAFFWTIISLVPVLLFGMTDVGWTFMDGSFSVVIDWATNCTRFVDLYNLLNLCFLGLFASAGCFVFWNVACRDLGVIKSTVCIYLIPFVSIFLSIVVDGEFPTIQKSIGAICILCGVLVANFKRSVSK